MRGGSLAGICKMEYPAEVDLQFIGKRIRGFRPEFERNYDGMNVADQKVILRRFVGRILLVALTGIEPVF